MKLLYPLAKRFIAGYDFDSAKKPISKLIKSGYKVSINYVGEESKTANDCFWAFSQYSEIIDFYRDEEIDLSIKLTQLGLFIDKSLCLNLLFKITERAKKRGHTIRLDMENSQTTTDTINFCLRVKKDHDNIGVAIQANLLRSSFDIHRLIENKVSIRLVKGAYQEDTLVALQGEDRIASAFFHLAMRLKIHKANAPAIATHDEELIKKIFKSSSNPKYFDYEFLYGIRRDIQRRLKDDGIKVRIYVPFGENWLPYTLRRLREWKNFKFVFFNIFKEWKHK